MDLLVTNEKFNYNCLQMYANVTKPFSELGVY